MVDLKGRFISSCLPILEHQEWQKRRIDRKVLQSVAMLPDRAELSTGAGVRCYSSVLLQCLLILGDAWACALG